MHTPAIARCEAESHVECSAFGNSEKAEFPLFAFYREGAKDVCMVTEQTETTIGQKAAEKCREDNVTCVKIGVFDAHKTGTVVRSLNK